MAHVVRAKEVLRQLQANKRKAFRFMGDAGSQVHYYIRHQPGPPPDYVNILLKTEINLAMYGPNKYHRVFCTGLGIWSLLPSHWLECFQHSGAGGIVLHRQTAIDSGYLPCRICKPNEDTSK